MGPTRAKFNRYFFPRKFAVCTCIISTKIDISKVFKFSISSLNCFISADGAPSINDSRSFELGDWSGVGLSLKRLVCRTFAGTAPLKQQLHDRCLSWDSGKCAINDLLVMKVERPHCFLRRPLEACIAEFILLLRTRSFRKRVIFIESPNYAWRRIAFNCERVSYPCPSFSTHFLPHVGVFVIPLLGSQGLDPGSGIWIHLYPGVQYKRT